MTRTDIEAFPVEDGFIAHLVDHRIGAMNVIIRLAGGDEIRNGAATAPSCAGHGQFRVCGCRQQPGHEQNCTAFSLATLARCGFRNGNQHAQSLVENKPVDIPIHLSNSSRKQEGTLILPSMAAIGYSSTLLHKNHSLYGYADRY